MTTVTQSPGHAAETHHDHHELSFVQKYIFSKDHKIIGMQFLFVGLLMFLVGGFLALCVRWQLAWPADLPGGALLEAIGLANAVAKEGGRVVYQMGGETYTMLFTMHASIMIFLVIIPLLTGAFGNFLIPLQIGARDMAFPTLNMASFWVFMLGVGIVVASFFYGGAAAGWTSYPALAGTKYSPQFGQTLWCMGVFTLGWSSILGSINYITTFVKMRAPGMHFFRMPLTSWALFITSILVLFGTPVLGSALFMLTIDRLYDANFFTPATGGQPLLWQHLFWFYSHPAVYIMILPAMGMVSDIMACFCRKPIFGYKPMIYSIGGIAFLGFLVWGHHMFMSGMNPYLGMTFMISTTMIALPSAVKVFNWLATMWNSDMHLTVPMLNSLAFVSMFIIGGLSGIFMSSTPVDIQIHDTYFIVGHIHYVLFGGTMFGIFGAIQFWFPKMFGRLMNVTIGKIHFWISFVAFNCTFFPMHILGMAAHPRRIGVGYDYVNGTAGGGYEFLQDVQWMNVFMTVSAAVLGCAQLLLMANFIWSIFKGKPASANPWRATTLEWCATPVVPGHGNFGPKLPTVYRGAFEYSSPLVEEDFLPQNRKLETETT